MVSRVPRFPLSGVYDFQGGENGAMMSLNITSSFTIETNSS